jgi:RNA polymerase-binding transcription factor DksA
VSDSYHAAATLVCPRCDWCRHCLAADLLQRLQKLGVCRRANEPPVELLTELLPTYADRLLCDQCGQAGLTVQQNGTDTLSRNDLDQEDWQQAIVCEVCHQPISSERIEVFPQAKRCVSCQDQADRGTEPIEPDFCPKCGALVELRVSRGSGLTRYKQFCTAGCRLS